MRIFYRLLTTIRSSESAIRFDNYDNNLIYIYYQQMSAKLYIIEQGSLILWFFFFADNHDIISMKFYETEIPVTATDDEGDVDRSRIVPVATGAEPYRGMEILDTILRHLFAINTYKITFTSMETLKCSK